MRDLIKSKKFNKLFFLGEKARFWAENTIDPKGISASDFLIKKFKFVKYDVLLIHPENGWNIPNDFEGLVIGWKEDIGDNFSN